MTTSRKQLRIERAKERKAVYDKLTIPQKIIKIDIQFGKDKGAAKQREKLLIQMEKEKELAEKQKNKPQVEEKVKEKKKHHKNFNKPKRS